MRGRDLVMWSEGQWEASKKITWKGDIYINIYGLYRRTSRLYERIGQGPILWKFKHAELYRKYRDSLNIHQKCTFYKSINKKP